MVNARSQVPTYHSSEGGGTLGLWISLADMHGRTQDLNYSLLPVKRLCAMPEFLQGEGPSLNLVHLRSTPLWWQWDHDLCTVTFKLLGSVLIFVNPQELVHAITVLTCLPLFKSTTHHPLPLQWSTRRNLGDKGRPETVQTPNDGEMLMPIYSSPGCFFYRLSVLARLTNSSIVWLVSPDSQPPEHFAQYLPTHNTRTLLRLRPYKYIIILNVK